MCDPEILKNVSIFKNLSDDEAEKVTNLCGEQKFEPGDIIIEEDTKGEGLYIIRSGKARVVKLEGGYERNIAEVGPGEHIGEMSLIDDMNTSARVVAEEPTVCLALRKEDLDLAMDSDDKLHIKILRSITATLTERLRRTSEDLMVWKLEFNEDM